MADCQVTCINKTDRLNRYERIRNIGGTGGGGWTRTQQQAIRDIETGANSYFVFEGGVRADVIIANHLGNQYLKTNRDSTTKDNLLSLPECR